MNFRPQRRGYLVLDLNVYVLVLLQSAPEKLGNGCTHFTVQVAWAGKYPEFSKHLHFDFS